MKAYTDLEQSKKLAEILPIESADMSWVSNGLGKPFVRTIPIKGYPEELCACWSLAAMLEIISGPVLTYIGKNNWNISTFEDDYYKGEVNSSNPTDACYEMIIKFHEQVRDNGKPKWSEEDEGMMSHCIGAIHIAGKQVCNSYTAKDKEQMKNWLKSLKQRMGGEQ